MKGEPTQHHIDKVSYDESMVRRPKPKLKFSDAQRIGAREVLRKMGLICLALTLCACQMPLR
jgi:hypothetical protein